MENEIIVIEQLPIITEKLQEIKAEVTSKVEETLLLACTPDTLTAVKKARADLNKDFKDFEERRKYVKNAILKPYGDFEAVYKDCVSDVFKKADMALKGKIDGVEIQLKDEKRAEVKSYFDEYLASKNIDFVDFNTANINVTLSASMKSLKEQAKAFIDRICDDLNLINTQEHKDEILFHYKKIDGFSFLNSSKSITFVAEKYKAIEAEKAKEAERQAKAEAEQKAAKKVETVVETLTPPTVEPIAPPVEEEKILTIKFTVRGTLPKLKALKEFLKKGGYDYE